MGYYDPEPAFKSQQSLTDEGTREKHLLELLELWKSAWQLMEDRREYSYVSEYEAKQQKKLEGAIEIVEKQLTGYKGYDWYSNKFYREEVDKPLEQENISDGVPRNIGTTSRPDSKS